MNVELFLLTLPIVPDASVSTLRGNSPSEGKEKGNNILRDNRGEYKKFCDKVILFIQLVIFQ